MDSRQILYASIFFVPPFSSSLFFLPNFFHIHLYLPSSPIFTLLLPQPATAHASQSSICPPASRRRLPSPHVDLAMPLASHRQSLPPLGPSLMPFLQISRSSFCTSALVCLHWSASYLCSSSCNLVFVSATLLCNTPSTHRCRGIKNVTNGRPTCRVYYSLPLPPCT